VPIDGRQHLFLREDIIEFSTDEHSIILGCERDKSLWFYCQNILITLYQFIISEAGDKDTDICERG